MNTQTVKQEVQDLYRRRAERYDLTANLYYLGGFREERYRREAVDALGLKAGDTVVELGCGTGLNFRHLEEAVGPSGRVVGVDLTDAMLDQARERVRRHGWDNVELVLGDAAEARLPERVAGVLSTFALSLVPRLGETVERATAALAPGGRLAVLDLKAPPPPLDRALPLLLPAVRPFGVERRHLRERPWETIWGAMYRHLTDVHVDEHYAGMVFLAHGRKT